jgi:tryptophan-rich sensory protein
MTDEARTAISLGRQIVGLTTSILVCFAAAGLGSVVTTSKIPNWYVDLTKPEWTPPDWVFGPVWTALYIGMAVAAWLVWRQRGIGAARLPFALFATQLVLNSMWSVLFFGFQQPGVAFIEILLLWAAILATLIAFWRHSTLAGLLLFPYLAWVSFAAVLNWAIWCSNR